MPRSPFPKPTLTLTKTEARRFMFAHHHLWPPRQLKGKAGILEFIRRVGSIQFDPINIVGRNPDLVLQSRVGDYYQGMLDEILYEDRLLVDGWDKQASLHATTDWPNFSRRRAHLRTAEPRHKPPEIIIAETMQEIHQRGPLSSLDFKDYEKVDWHWGPTKAVRAALEYQYTRGYLGVHHRVNNRRSFDLIERLLPENLLSTPDPFETEEAYQDWHILRRVGGMGLVNNRGGENWSGILHVKTRERRVILNRLIDNGTITPISITEIPDHTFFIRSTDLSTLERVRNETPPNPGAGLVAPLDNLIWNRDLINQIFDFEYIWEVYKPKTQRRWGYYVLPVFYGDRFVARVDPAFDKKKRILTIQNWWWEAGVQPGEAMIAALLNCLNDFCAYLQTEQTKIGEAIRDQKDLSWLQKLE